VRGAEGRSPDGGLISYDLVGTWAKVPIHERRSTRRSLALGPRGGFEVAITPEA
jgi:hypothetical protein